MISKFYKHVAVLALPVLTITGIVLGFLFKEMCFLTIVGWLLGSITSGSAWEMLNRQRDEEQDNKENSGK